MRLIFLLAFAVIAVAQGEQAVIRRSCPRLLQYRFAYKYLNFEEPDQREMVLDYGKRRLENSLCGPVCLATALAGFEPKRKNAAYRSDPLGLTQVLVNLAMKKTRRDLFSAIYAERGYQ